MSALSDSGFEEDLHTSPAAASSVGLTPDLQECDYDESCFIIQRHNELQFLAQNCLARQPQVRITPSVLLLLLLLLLLIKETNASIQEGID